MKALIEGISYEIEKYSFYIFKTEDEIGTLESRLDVVLDKDKYFPLMEQMTLDINKFFKGNISLVTSDSDKDVYVFSGYSFFSIDTSSNNNNEIILHFKKILN